MIPAPMTLAAPTPCGLKPKLPVEGDGFVFGEEIDVLALEFLDEQFSCGSLYLGETAKYGDLRAVCAGCRRKGRARRPS